MPNGNGNSSRKPKPKPNGKKKANGNGQANKSLLQKGEDFASGVGKNIQGAGKAIGAAYDRSQAARKGIFKGMGGNG